MGNCGKCAMRGICLPEGMDVEEFDQVITQRKRVRRREHLYRAGDEADGKMYVLRLGALKVCQHGVGSQRQISAFHMSGSVLGMEDVYALRRRHSAVALEDCEICVVDYERLERLCGRSEAARRHFHMLLVAEVRAGQRVAAMLRNSRADQRFAAFLLELSAAYAQRGYAANAFRLTMSRQDIGDYLGLTAESISRLLNHFRSAGYVTAERRQMALCEPAALRTLAYGPPPLMAMTGHSQAAAA